MATADQLFVDLSFVKANFNGLIIQLQKTVEKIVTIFLFFLPQIKKKSFEIDQQLIDLHLIKQNP